MSKKSPGEIAYEAYWLWPQTRPTLLPCAWENLGDVSKNRWERVGEAFTSIRPSVDEQTDDSSGVPTVTND